MNKEEKHSTKCPICGKPTHKESKYCIFHASAEEKNEEDFIRELKKRIKEIQKKDKDYNFERFIFIGDIDFRRDLKVTMLKNAVFMDASFEGDTMFWDTTFKGHVVFKEATFKRYAAFGRITFEGHADFRGVTFKRYTYFKGVTFEEDVDFKGAIFEGCADFRGAIFEKDAAFGVLNIKEGFNHIKGNILVTVFQEISLVENKMFGKVIFEGYADFSEATFKEDACFNGATFKEDADFRLKYFVKNLYFSRINAFSGKNIFIRLNNEKGKIFFERSYLENTYLDMELVKGVLIDFTDISLRNTKIEKDKIKNHILQEKKKNYHEAKEIYVLLKNNFHSIGKYNEESWAFKKEKDMERKSNCHFKTLHKWLWSCFLNGIFGYG